MSKHILLVEDERLLRYVLKDKLTDSGYKVTLATNGREGLESALKIKPDLILLDVLMPIMNGAEMLAKLRTNKWGAGVPVIMLTNTSDFQSASDALKMNPKDYIIKSETDLDKIPQIVSERLV